jgi:predicted metalloprotease with PDZ domain
MIAAVLLDLEIGSESNKSLDDVMRALYTDFYKKQGRGFTHDEFIAVCSQMAGRDMTSFFDKVIFSTTPLNYDEVFSKYGIEIKDQNVGKVTAWSGVVSKMDGGKNVIANIYTGSPAVEAGLSVNDEILSVDGWRVTTQLEKQDSKHDVNSEVEIIYARDGKVYTTTMTYTQSHKVDYKLTIADADNKKCKAWLSLD